jgi:hypothetical protein
MWSCLYPFGYLVPLFWLNCWTPMYAINKFYCSFLTRIMLIPKKRYESPPCPSSRDSASSQRWEDPLSLALGKEETRGRLTGIGYGAPWKTYLPKSPKLARIRQRSRKEWRTHAFQKNVEAHVLLVLQRMGVVQELPPLHPHTSLPPRLLKRIGMTQSTGLLMDRRA